MRPNESQNIFWRVDLQEHWTITDHVEAESSSSSCCCCCRNEYYLGGIIALLLQDHRTVSTKSVCSSQYMVTDQH